MNIKALPNVFKGPKIPVKQVLDKEIIVKAYKIEPSKFEGEGDRLVLAVIYKDDDHIIFTSSRYLKEAVVQVTPDKFPFKTIIRRIDECYQFT